MKTYPIISLLGGLVIAVLFCPSAGADGARFGGFVVNLKDGRPEITVKTEPVIEIDPILVKKPVNKIDPAFAAGPAVMTPPLALGPSSGAATDDGPHESVPGGDFGVTPSEPEIVDDNDGENSEPPQEGTPLPGKLDRPEESVLHHPADLPESGTGMPEDVSGNPRNQAQENPMDAPAAPAPQSPIGGGCSLVRD